MHNKPEVCPNEETAWVLPDKKFIIHNKTLGGMCNCRSFWNNIGWLIVSKALE